MIKSFITLAFMVVSSSVLAQASWTLRDTPDGVVYRTEVIGVSTRDKITHRSRTALTLACGIGIVDPMIMLQWEAMDGSGIRRVNYSVDNKPMTPGGSGMTMSATNDILYRRIVDSQELLQSMKSSSIITFDWVGLDQTRYLTVFNLSTFRSNLSEFNKRCNIE